VALKVDENVSRHLAGADAELEIAAAGNDVVWAGDWDKDPGDESEDR
jgi:hypothetical protein